MESMTRERNNRGDIYKTVNHVNKYGGVVMCVCLICLVLSSSRRGGLVGWSYNWKPVVFQPFTTGRTIVD